MAMNKNMLHKLAALLIALLALTSIIITANGQPKTDGQIGSGVVEYKTIK